MKKNYLIIAIIVIPLFVWIIWLFQTHKPSEKTIVYEQNNEKAISDSTRIAYEKRVMIDEYYNMPFISGEELAIIEPTIKKWADFYKVDLSQMRAIIHWDWEPYADTINVDTLRITYRKFTNKDDTDTLTHVNYSPDKQLYIDLGINYEYSDDKPYPMSYANCQNVYLTDRKARRHYDVLSMDSTGFAEAAFWVGNDMFIIAGHDSRLYTKRFVRVFDLKNITLTLYEILISEDVVSVK